MTQRDLDVLHKLAQAAHARLEGELVGGQHADPIAASSRETSTSGSEARHSLKLRALY